MSIYNRDYMRDEGRYQRPSGPANWSVVIWLLVINVGVYVLNNLIFFDPRRDLFGLSFEALESFRLWTPVTYQFVHANLWHILGNMVSLFFVGRILLLQMRPKHVLRLYLLGGLAGGALQLLWNFFFGDSPIVGASGSVLAVTFGLTTLMPHQRVHFFSIASLTLRHIAWALLAINAFTLILTLGSKESQDQVAVMAHFGGMLLGWAYIQFGWHKAGSFTTVKSARAKRKGAFGVRIVREGDGRTGSGSAPSEKKAPFVTSDVDAILDKINEHGFQSLTAEERQVLEQSSQRLSRRIDRES